MAKALSSLLVVACIILSTTQLLAAQTTTPPPTADAPPTAEAMGAKAAATLKDNASDTIASITAAAGSDPKNADIVSDATSKINTKEKEELTAMKAAVASSNIAAIQGALSSAVSYFQLVKAAAMANISPSNVLQLKPQVGLVGQM